MVRRIAKKAAKVLWRMGAPVRRPLRRRFDARIEALISNTVNARMMPPLIEALAISGRRLERIEETLASANQAAASIAEEMDLVLGGVSRELFRLQAQVEELRAIVADSGRETATGLSLVDEAGDDAPVRRPMASERSKVG